MTQPLPIDVILPDVARALGESPAAVLIAAPGAGKTTRVPLALVDQPWLSGRSIVMLEPRRLAARMAAERMAATLGQRTGETVGYRVRLDAKVSRATRIEVVTEGILTRRLQRDAELNGVGVVIFDEFHERSLDADLGLALILDVQRALRPDLKILVMSATIDARQLSAFLGGAPVIESPHRPFPVSTIYLPPRPQARIEDSVAAAVRQALDDETGSVLAFLPGEREIRRVEERLRDAVPDDVDVCPLFGAMPWQAQTRAVEPAPPGRRKAVLATTIAETSLTIEGVRIVVDCGFKRVSRFDVGRGMSELATVRVSKAAAEQRRGRAGRLSPGVCYRLWPEAEDRALAAFDPPEIAADDLAPLMLDLAAWGVADPAALSWLTPPPPAAVEQARDLLRRLGALDDASRITAEGKAMADLPLHPRLAHLVHRGLEMGHGPLARDLAAVLSDRDIAAASRDPDLRLRLEMLAGHGAAAGKVPGGVHRVRDAAAQIGRLAGISGHATSREAVGLLTALAYPDRIAQQRGAPGKFRLSGGGSAMLDPADPLAGAPFLAIAQSDGAARDARVFLAAPVTQAELEDAFAADLSERDEVVWDDRQGAVAARRVRRLGALVLSEKPLARPDPDLVLAAMLDGVRALGLGALPWTDGAHELRARVAFARQHDPGQPWPDFADAALVASLPDWLGPFLAGITRRGQLAQIDVREALMAQLTWSMRQRLDDIAPERLIVPSGSAVRVDYAADGGPAVAVKLQEVFGLTSTPTVGGGRVPVTLHLLSPAQRPVAVTRDLASFWANVYPQVRGEMRGRYPRHIWPEDPLAAAPTRRSLKPRGT
ncbi:MAG: ATP-dependent helicase HrpB [Rhodospirillaceae bacterium]|nr:ATP-dependent helicase HrpB [Rhodospirillaceae bacterium]